MDLARRWLGPPRRGLEIGASSTNPFPGVDAWNLDYPGAEVFQAEQAMREGSVVGIDVLGVGDRLPFASESLDFVLASHVLEHMPDTLRALREWGRVVARDGVVFLILPHRERTFDAHRPRTELAHHLADWATGMTIEASALVPTSHYHVWQTEDLVALIESANRWGVLDWQIEVVEDVDSKLGNGFTIVARRRGHPALRPPRSAAGPVSFHLLTLDLPFQVFGKTTEFVAHGPVEGANVPRGRYRVQPIHAAEFPPVAGAAFTVEIGAPLPPPRLTSARIEAGRLRFEGESLDAATYLEADFRDDLPARLVLPEFVDGRLELDVAGIAFPSNAMRVRAVTLPPGGGASAVLTVDAHLR